MIPEISIANPNTIVSDNKMDDGATMASTPANTNRTPEINQSVFDTPVFIKYNPALMPGEKRTVFSIHAELNAQFFPSPFYKPANGNSYQPPKPML